MSLVNDMLRDLAGQQPLQLAEDDHEQLMADSGLARKQRRMWLPSLMIFLLVLVVMTLGLNQFFARKQQANSPAEQVQLVSTTPASAVPVQGVAAADSIAEIPAPAATTAREIDDENENINGKAGVEFAEANTISIATDEAITEGAVNPNSRGQLAAIAPWLKLAGNALAQDRLTSPVEDSAWHYYQQVLAIEPQHSQALQGLAAITARYLQLANDALQQQELVRAHTLLRRAKLVTPENEGVAKFEALLTQVQTTEPSQSVNALPTDQQAEKPAGNIEQGVAMSAQPDSYSLPEQTTVVAPQLQVTPNRDWQDQQAAAQARAFMQQGQVQRARMQLENFLQQHGASVHSSQLLCQIYLDQGELVKAAQLLLDADQWPVSERVRMRAQMHIAQGNNAEALTLLEANLAKAENDERYRALLASLYHTVGNYHESIASYRRLISVFGEKSAYWLGLALALDALEQNTTALEAYRRAYQFQPLQAEVNKYIEQRVAALSR